MARAGTARVGSERAAVLPVVHIYREESSGEEIIRIISARIAAGDDSGIDFGDIPRLTGKQLANRSRTGTSNARSWSACALILRCSTEVERRRPSDAHQRHSHKPDGS